MTWPWNTLRRPAAAARPLSPPEDPLWAGVPARLGLVIAAHLVMNYLDMPVPVLLAVHGPPGQGKSTAVRRVCERMGIDIVRPGAGRFESRDAGSPAAEFAVTYERAGRDMGPTCHRAIVIEDFDQVLGRRELVQVTVNHQLLNATLMAIADDPHRVPDPMGESRAARRVPLVLTANDLPRVHGPLRRDGRMRRLTWEPGPSEQLAVLGRLFPDTPITLADLRDLGVGEPVRTGPSAPARPSISTFAGARALIIERRVVALIEPLGPERVLAEFHAGLADHPQLTAPITREELMGAVRDVIESANLYDHTEVM